MKNLPWKTDASMGDEIVRDARGHLIADCAIMLRGRTAAQNQAHARLCAAAPELLAMVAILADGVTPSREAARALLDRVGGNELARPLKPGLRPRFKGRASNSGNYLPWEMVEQIRALDAEGKSQREIAAAVGCSKVTVVRYLNRNAEALAKERPR